MRALMRLSQWLGLGIGLAATALKGAEVKDTPRSAESHGKCENGKVRFQMADAVGVFRLGYVDCEPYGGPEQVIEIEKSGVIECIQDEHSPGTEESCREHGRQKVGRLMTGSVLKGELRAAPDFRSVVGGVDTRIVGMRMQIVSLPGGSGMWFAMTGVRDGEMRSWDEIYLRKAEVLA